jgi:hypothetical protein
MKVVGGAEAAVNAYFILREKHGALPRGGE